ncbi:hypothetical protein QTP88_022723 [Uroleucon formosanum]
MIATHVGKLRRMAEQLLWEARELSYDGPEDTIGHHIFRRHTGKAYRPQTQQLAIQQLVTSPVGSQDQKLAVVEGWIQAMEVTPWDSVSPHGVAGYSMVRLMDSGGESMSRLLYRGFSIDVRESVTENRSG